MIPTSDPRFTAYALGEMTDAERQAFEAELAQSEEAQRHVAELSSAAELLRVELSQEAPPALGEDAREKIERAAAPPAAGAGSEKVAPVLRPSFGRRASYVLAPLAVAAAAALAIFASQSTMKSESALAPAEEAEKRGAAPPRPYGSAAAKSLDATAAATSAPMTASMDRVADDDAPDPRWTNEPSPQQPDAAPLPENPFVDTAKDTQSTFSIDVDTASYSLVRRLVESGQKPDASFVRIEEMVNYFPYSYPEPEDAAFGVYTDATAAPWAPSHRLVRIGLKGKTIDMAKRPASNLVFLVDVSGSMNSADKLGLVKKGFELLVEQLDERDSVSIVVYAGAAGLVLPPTPGNEKAKILGALEKLSAGGSTNGGQGIELAYATAAKSFVQGGTNRVILASDGDYNVGISDRAALVKLIQDKAKTGVFLTVLGVGLGNFKDTTMEQLANKGNGNYAYIDSLAEARKVLVDQAAGTLNTIAKDVKIQITFDPKAVQSFRLIGYENRVLSHKDFEDDTKDAGEIGAGHTVTALYEVVPKGTPSGEVRLADIALRYKQPDGATSRLVETSVLDTGTAFADASTDLRFAASVAGFGMLLRGSAHKGDLTFAKVVGIANGAIGDDPDGHRKAFVTLAKRAGGLYGE